MLEDATEIPSDELYRELQRSVEVCSNCLRLMPFDAFTGYTDRRSIEPLLVPVYLDGQGATEPGRGDKYRGRPPRCPHCGVSSVYDQLRPLSKADVKVLAANLSVTLDELGIAHDWLRLMDVALDLKTTPETASRDDDNLSRALQAAVDIEQRAVGVVAVSGGRA